MNSREEIFARISAILQELFEVDAADIHLQANLYSDLDIDSIDAVDLVVELQKITGKRIKPEDFKSVRTVQDVVVEVDKLVNGTTA
ncbi:acyl carrier protein [Pokkaliibacter plantistimulans]|uniref:Acyl carrier protein n=1 Tax=Pokkaliibacter plantistimulans TaxID=1635171 RepID=A0ABX5M270_9GAMM|nr:acyl carrier protein [Pokkaliibacter plantistimulans]PXF30975.1 acyl carrier protein [Pokkaliibacter plantistimulans]